MAENAKTPVQDDPYLTAKEAAQLVPGGVHPVTVRRWASSGVSVGGGSERVRLAHGRVGRRWVTRKSWLDSFFEKCRVTTG